MHATIFTLTIPHNMIRRKHTSIARAPIPIERNHINPFWTKTIDTAVGNAIKGVPSQMKRFAETNARIGSLGGGGSVGFPSTRVEAFESEASSSTRVEARRRPRRRPPVRIPDERTEHVADVYRGAG